MNTNLKRVGWILFLALVTYNIWAEMDRAKEKKTGWVSLPDFKTNFELDELGTNTGKGNLVGIQPYLTPRNYSTQFNFFVTLSFYFDQLRRLNLLNDKTVIVLPEYIGTWLVAAREKSSVYADSSMQDACRTLVTSNLYKFSGHYVLAPAGVRKSTYAIFRMKAATMASMYQATFGELAKKYHVTIVAGSIVLPEPVVKKGKLEIGSGQLYNCSAVFAPDGSIFPDLVRKIYPVNKEKEFTRGGNPAELPVFTTAAGRLAVLICADSWYPDLYGNLAGKADLVVVPSLAGTEKEWQQHWKGYDGGPTPADVDKSRINQISEGDAWLQYSMSARAVKAGIHNGLNVFFTGDCWDLKPEGRAIVLQNDSVTVFPPATRKGRIINSWIQ